MPTHALALLIAALAYTYARQHANDIRFVFDTGKLGDLAGYTSTIVLAMIALIIGYQATARLFAPVTIHFDEAIVIAAGGLIVNVATAWLLSGGGNYHGHEHGHGIDRDAHVHEGAHHIDTGREVVYGHEIDFAEGAHGGVTHASAATQDHNMRAAFVHGQPMPRFRYWRSSGCFLGGFLAGSYGSGHGYHWRAGHCQLGVWVDSEHGRYSLGYERRQGDRRGAAARHRERRDRLADLHIWRLGPGHYGAIVSILRDVDYYRSLSRFPVLSHVTIEVRRAAEPSNRSPLAGLLNFRLWSSLLLGKTRQS